MVTVGLLLDDTLYVDVYIEKIPIKKEIRSRTSIMSWIELNFVRVYPSLDSLYNVMIDNPAIIAGLDLLNSPCISDSYNLDLSQRHC